MNAYALEHPAVAAAALCVWPWAGASAAWVAQPALPATRLQPPLVALPKLLADAMHLPFDALREQHALAVKSGLIRKSMLESRDFELSVTAMEHAALGPFARQV